MTKKIKLQQFQENAIKISAELDKARAELEKLKADAESKSAVYKNGVDNWNAKEKVKIAKRERKKLVRSNYVGGDIHGVP